CASPQDHPPPRGPPGAISPNPRAGHRTEPQTRSRQAPRARRLRPPTRVRIIATPTPWLVSCGA
ncbi:MAG: hypothetical protein ACKOJF_06450, partial [Planctomycetaceae bacterium]